jgi:predicted Zn-dependent peptidase
MKRAWWVWVWILFGLRPVLAQQERFRKSPPIPDPLPVLELPKVESTRLMNGLTLAVASRPEQRVISLELVILAGESQSPVALPGLASFTAEMLRRGTPLVSAASLEERIDAIGGDFSTTTTPDFSRFSFHFLDGYLSQALETLSLMLLQPDFSDREIVALKRTQFYDLLQRQRDPEFVGRRQLLRILFQAHPYRRSFYSEDVFKSFSRKDVKSFYDRYYRPNNALIVLAGNLDLAIATKTVSHFLNTWPRKDIERPLLAAPEVNLEPRYCFVDLPKAKESMLIIGNLLTPRAEPDYFSLAVLNQVLGGTPFSRLFMNLREAKEFAYSASSRLEFFQCCGYYAVTAAVIPSSTVVSIREILGEVDRLAREKVSNFELEQAKSYLVGHFPLGLSRPDELVRRLAESLALSWGDSRWSRFDDNVTQVDADRIFEAARRYFSPKPVVVIVGNQDVLLDHLRELERLEVYDLKGVLLYTRIKGVEG